MITLKTNFGDISIELFEKEAPVTVENFLSYVRDGFYKNTIFHRIIDKFVINYQLNDSNIQKEIPIKTIPILPSKPGVHFEIQDGHEIYRCCLDNGSEVTKWMDVLNIFYEINKNKYKY